MQIPMSSPDITQAEIDAVTAVLTTSYLSIGPQIADFETAFARYIGVEHAIGVNSGTSGLHLCVIAAGVAEGDLVLTTPFSFIASANAILYERAVPVFVDVDPATGNIDPAQVTEAAADLLQGGAAADHWLPPDLRGMGGPAAAGHYAGPRLRPARRYGSDRGRGPAARFDHHRRCL